MAGGVQKGLAAKARAEDFMTDAQGNALVRGVEEVAGYVAPLAGWLQKANILLGIIAGRSVLGAGGGVVSAARAAVTRGGFGFSGTGRAAGLGAGVVGGAVLAAPAVAATAAVLAIHGAAVNKEVAQHAFSDAGSGLIGALINQARAWGLTNNPGWMAEWKRSVEPLVTKATSSGNSADQDRAVSALRALNHRYKSSYGVSGGGGSTQGGGNTTGGGQNSGSTAQATGVVTQAIHTAERFLGTPYRWGGSSPRTGFDCSGLTQWSYKAAGINLPRTAAQQQAATKPVSPNQTAPGDLLFLGNPAHHVMMSIGGGKVIEAPHTGDNVKIINFPSSAADGGVHRVIGGVKPGGAIMGSGAGGDAGDITGQTRVSGGTGAMLGGDGMFGPSSTGGTLASALGLLGAAGISMAASRAAASSGGQGPPTGAMPRGNVKQWISKALGIMHMDTPKNESDVYIITSHESSNNPRSINNWDSNAAAGHPSEGIMQTIPSTFAAHAMKGHGNIWNPVDNIIAGVRYAIGRYGSLDNVPGVKAVHSGGKYVGYETGKWRIARDELANLHRGEMVVPATTAEKLRQMVTEQAAPRSGGHIPSQGRRALPVRIVFHVDHATEQEIKRAAHTFIQEVEDHSDLMLVGEY